ncbi:MAG: hypothetical protein WD530_05515 [Vicingaceae bacterium]
MTKRTSRRISPSSAYIGAGNKTSIFSRKARKPFEDISDIYKQAIKKDSDQDYRESFRKLTEEEKIAIKQKIRKQNIKTNQKLFFAIILTVLFSVALLYLLIFLIKNYCC